MLTTIFIVSLLMLSMMFGFKWAEERRGKKLFLEQLRRNVDISVMKIILRLGVFFSVLSRRNGKLFLMFLFVFLSRITSGIRRIINLKKMKFLNSLRVSGNLEKNSPASFFLKNVSEYKNKHKS